MTVSVLRLYLDPIQLAMALLISKKVYSLDEYRFGMNALWWYNRTGEEKYKTAADDIRGMLARHPRTPSGGVSIFQYLFVSPGNIDLQIPLAVLSIMEPFCVAAVEQTDRRHMFPPPPENLFLFLSLG